MIEFDQIEEEISKLENIFNFLEKNNYEIYYRNIRVKFQDFKNSLQKIKLNLLQIKQKLNNLEESLVKQAKDSIDDLCFSIDDFYNNLGNRRRDLIYNEIDMIKRIFTTIKGTLPLAQLELQVDVNEILNKIPEEIVDEIKFDFEEVRKCYSVSAYRAVISFCGRILEVALSRKYYEKKMELDHESNPEEINEELGNLTLGQVISRCRDVGIMLDVPGLEETSGLINKVRVWSIHHKIRVYKPGPDEANGTINFTKAIIKKLFFPDE
jgi:hypothetical protein